MTEWFYADSSRQQHGPLSAGEIQSLRERGEIDWDTLIWREGLPQWHPLRVLAAEIDPTTLPPAYAPAAAAVQAPAVSGAPSPEAPPAQTAVPGEIVYAGFWRRVAAYMVDGLLLGMLGLMVQLPVFLAVGIFSGTRPRGDMSPGMLLAFMVAYLLPIGLQALYYAWGHSRPAQATFGKQLVGIKVTGLNGEHISFARGIGRYFALLLSSFTLLVGFIMAGFTERKQALHDMVASTLVVDQYAYTATPQYQERGLGAAAKVILWVMGALYVLGFVFLIFVLIAAANAG